ncbi:MAG TPA: hypothetical protein VNO75_11215, partial [Gemmatimonadaceae bacterium]|nr:hypothetical protein [Gemmatimonadaceae bacterium]
MSLLRLLSLSLGLKLTLGLRPCLLRDGRVALGFLPSSTFGIRAFSLCASLCFGSPLVSCAESCVSRHSGETAFGIFDPCRRSFREKIARDGIAQEILKSHDNSCAVVLTAVRSEVIEGIVLPSDASERRSFPGERRPKAQERLEPRIAVEICKPSSARSVSRVREKLIEPGGESGYRLHPSRLVRYHAGPRAN